MTHRPGPMLQRMCGLLVVLGAAMFFVPAVEYLAFLVLAAIPVLIAMDYRSLRRMREGVAAAREVPSPVQRQAPFDVTVTVSNTLAEPVTAEIRDCLPPAAEPTHWIAAFTLSPGEKRTLSYRVTIPRRGAHTFGPFWIRIRGPLGVVERRLEREGTDVVKVLPDPAGSRDALSPDALAERQLLDQWTETPLRGNGLEFESIDEFRRGDDPRRIDWRSSARQRRLMVRRYQLELHRDVVVLVDSGRLMAASAGDASKLDCAVDASLMLARVALEKGDRFGFGVFDDRVRRYVPPQAGAGAYHTIVDHAYDIQSAYRETDFGMMFAELKRRQPKRALVVVISDLVDVETTTKLRAALVALARSHVLILAAVSTPRIEQTARGEMSSLVNVSRVAVSLRLLREREKALHSLVRSGVRILDVTPGMLTIPLVNKYIELRERNVM